MHDFFVPRLACGDYECRKLYMDLGFAKSGERYFPDTRGAHSVEITAADYAGNSAAKTFTWTVQ